MKTYKIEISLNPEQIIQYNKTIGTCRFVYNLFLDTNKKLYEENKGTDKEKFMSDFTFGVWLNNKFLLEYPEYKWVKEVSSKAVKKIASNANKAFTNFFRKNAKFPRYKKRDKNDCSYYFVRSDKNTLIKHERHRIKIPCLGWCKIREYGYLPLHSTILSGTITRKAGRYYASILVDENIKIQQHNINQGIGIDLGVKDFAILSDGTKFGTLKYTKLEKRLKKGQRVLSRKIKNKKKGDSGSNIKKQILNIQRIHQRISNTRNDYLNKVVLNIIKREPSFITIEDLNVSGMMKNRHLSKAIGGQGFNIFRQKLEYKCKLNNIELRVVDRYFPSSKTCHSCGCIKEDLTLKDRVFICRDCGEVIDRDVNAAINLMTASKYKVLV